MNAQNKTKCPETASTLILYLYGEAENPSAFEEHLDGCVECREALASHRKVIAAYRAEAVEAPRRVKALATESLWDKALNFFRTPTGRPILAGAAAMVVIALIAVVAIRPHTPGVVPSYTEMEYNMDRIDDDLDSLFAMNRSNESVADIGNEPATHQGLTDIDSELDDIQNNAWNF